MLLQLIELNTYNIKIQGVLYTKLAFMSAKSYVSNVTSRRKLIKRSVL